MSVAVEIFRELQIARRHELHLAHRAGPGAAQAWEVDVAAVHNLQRVEQLASEESGAPRVPGERRERGERRTYPAEAAVVRLDSPDGDDDSRRDAVALGDLIEQRQIGGVGVAAASDELWRQPPGDVFLQREDDFRLRAIALDDDRLRLDDVGERGVDDVLTDASRQRLGAHACQPLGERRARSRLELLGGRWCSGKNKSQRGRAKMPCAHANSLHGFERVDRAARETLPG